MYGRVVRNAAAAFFAAFIVALAATPGGYNQFRFSLGNYNRLAEDQAIRETLKLFSGTTAGIFLTGGGMQGINILPADQLVKRRIYQDTRYLLNQGMVLAHDRDRSDVRQVRLLSPSHAIAIVDEAWFLAYQNSATRRLLSNKKANFITVRYFLRKVGGKWGVMDYEVYPRNQKIPEVRTMGW